MISFWLIHRVKDNDFVLCAMKKVIPAVLEKALTLGSTISQIIHKVSESMIFFIKMEYLILKFLRLTVQVASSGTQGWSLLPESFP